MTSSTRPVALITGGAHRIGAEIARTLHRSGLDIVLHYRSSREAAEELKRELERQRPDSVFLVKGDLCDMAQLSEVSRGWGHRRVERRLLCAVFGSNFVYEGEPRIAFGVRCIVDWRSRQAGGRHMNCRGRQAPEPKATHAD